jgi:hypothetical protein
LILHKTHDRIVEVGASRYFSAHMPNAKYIEMPGADHFFFIDCERILTEVKNFMHEEQDTLADTWIGIVLYINLPNLKRLEKVLQTELKEARAKGIFFSEGEATAAFDSPSRAIQCALKLKELVTDESLHICLHVGECGVENGKPTQSVLEIARRAAEFAPQNKVIVTQTLRDILAGSGVVFDLRQIHIDKKKTENVSLYTLR